MLAGAAELFDLPADVVAGLPHVEVVGNREFYMENHRGILSYGGGGGSPSTPRRLWCASSAGGWSW